MWMEHAEHERLCTGAWYPYPRMLDPDREDLNLVQMSASRSPLMTFCMRAGEQQQAVSRLHGSVIRPTATDTGIDDLKDI